MSACERSEQVKPAEDVSPTTPAVSATQFAPFVTTVKVEPVKDDPNAFISEMGNFKITLPPGFPEFTLNQGNPDDPADIALSYVSEKHGQAGCMVMVNSSDGWAKANPKASLDAVRDGNVSSNPENTLEKEEDLILNGFPGRRVFISQQSGLIVYFICYDIFLVRDKLYQVMYLTNRKSDLDSSKIKAYFDSFHLLEEPKMPK
jgi:hypothetical protein